jgi:hypothetical protein
MGDSSTNGDSDPDDDADTTLESVGPSGDTAAERSEADATAAQDQTDATNEDASEATWPGSPFTRLTRAEYRATVQAAFGIAPEITLLPEDARLGPFTSNASTSTDPVHPYLLAAEDIAATIVPALRGVCETPNPIECVPVPCALCTVVI